MWSYLFVKNTTKIKISVSKRVSNMNCMNYDHNQFFGLFKFQSVYRKFYLNRPNGYSRKIINVQTSSILWKVVKCSYALNPWFTPMNVKPRMTWNMNPAFRLLRNQKYVWWTKYCALAEIPLFINFQITSLSSMTKA